MHLIWQSKCQIDTITLCGGFCLSIISIKLNKLELACSRISLPLRKKLACLLFDFGVIPHVQATMIVDNRFRRSHSVFNSWEHLRCDDGRTLLTIAVVWRQVEQDSILICQHLKKLKPGYLPRGGCLWRMWMGNRIGGDNLLIMFWGNSGSILRSFRLNDHGTDKTYGQTDDRRTRTFYRDNCMGR